MSCKKYSEGFYIFGAGKKGTELRAILEKFDLFLGFIDNSLEKQQNGWKGARVLSFSQYCLLNKYAKVVIAATSHNEKDISKEIKDAGFLPSKDFFTWDEFISEELTKLLYEFRGKVYVELAQICLTERCTLKCKKCAHACNLVPIDTDDMSLEYAKYTADTFFSKVDYCNEFVLIGGEPFLYKNLFEIIEYIGEKYRSQINIFSITTNGTIVPKDDILTLLRKYNVTLRVSDYSFSNPQLQNRYDLFYKKTKNCDVRVFATKNDSWMDYGFGEIDRGADTNILRCAFELCNTPCREIHGSKYYYCVMAHTVAKNKGINIGKDDYLDFNTIKNREEIVNFQLGKLKKGYLDMCRYCRGMVEAKDYPIPAAEQM